MAYEEIKERITAGEFDVKSFIDMSSIIQKDKKYARFAEAISSHQTAIDELKQLQDARQLEILTQNRRTKANLEAQFRIALEEEYGMVGHPSAEKVWNSAWERGHSEGWPGILREYDELIDIIRQY